MTQSFNMSELSAYHVLGIMLTITGTTKEIKDMHEVFKELLVKLEKHDLFTKAD